MMTTSPPAIPSREISLSDLSDKNTIESKELGLRGWRRADARWDLQFTKDLEGAEPHMHRKRAILIRHPQVKLLFGVAWETGAIACLIAANQILLSYFFGRRLSDSLPGWAYWGLFSLVSTVIGGSLTAMVGVVVHEVCHNLAHPSPLVNRMFGFIVNLPMIVPVAASFKRYHLEHHAWQGVPGRDPDLPMEWEIRLIRGRTVAKLFWIAIYPIMYGVRSLALGRPPSDWEIINAVFCLVADLIIIKIVGLYGLLYLTASVWFGYSFHPAAAHFIQEHYTFISGQETYSYYGPLNWIFLNIGLHNEHHDFAMIPWTRAWALYHLAKEYYEPLRGFSSWTRIHWNFITDQSFGPVCRLVRDEKVHWKGRKALK